MAVKCTKMIDVDSLYFADNVRTPECLKIPAMVESLKRHGFKTNHPLVLSEKGDGRFLVLIGNRRGMALQFLRDNDREVYLRALPGGKIPAIVHRNLTVEEEVDLRIDHSKDEDREPLDEWSVFLAIKQLVQIGMDTQERIAVKLGLFKIKGKEKGQPNRQYVQPRVNLARLPQFVQDEFRKLTLDKDTTPVRWVKVAGLYKAYNEEYVDFQDGSGPIFQKLWTEIMTPPEVVEGSDNLLTGRDPKELSPAEAIKRSQGASSKGLKEALLVITRQSDGNLAQIDAQIAMGETALRTLDSIRNYLGPDPWQELLTSAHAHAQEQQAQQTEEEIEEETVSA